LSRVAERPRLVLRAIDRDERAAGVSSGGR
jgi:hypothetical protein